MIQTFLITLVTQVGIQIGAILGLFFVFGWLLLLIQRQTHRLYHKSVGWIGILWTAWIGTPVHELSHAILCIVFRHKIEDIHFFQPNKSTGGLGHVEHSYRTDRLYPKIGNFFIGAAPYIGGIAALILCTIFLTPNWKSILAPLAETQLTIENLFSHITAITTYFFSLDYTSWKSWLFWYLTFAVVSHIAPSPEDLRGMWRGFFWFTLTLIILNIFALAVRLDITSFILLGTRYTHVLIGLFFYAAILSVFHLLVAFIALMPFRLLRK